MKLQATVHLPVNLEKFEHHFVPTATKISTKY